MGILKSILGEALFVEQFVAQFKAPAYLGWLAASSIPRLRLLHQAFYQDLIVLFPFITT